MTFTITPLTPTDLPALGEFASASFTRTFGYIYQPHDLAFHLSNACSASYFESVMHSDAILLVKEGGTIIGYSKTGDLIIPATPLTPNDKEIHRLYIHHDYHGKGVAKALMDAVLASLSDAPNVFLGVYSENPRAQKFYARYGFTKIGEYDYPVGSHVDREWMMVRKNYA